jgi:hypothetical protein
MPKCRQILHWQKERRYRYQKTLHTETDTETDTETNTDAKTDTKADNFRLLVEIQVAFKPQLCFKGNQEKLKVLKNILFFILYKL